MKIFFDTVGCRLNQSEIEQLANIFRAAGHEIVGDATNADVAVVNTCAVTVKAAADSRKKLRRAARKGAREVIATGCWATLYPERARALEGVTQVIANDEKDSLVSKLLNMPAEDISRLQLIREPLPGERARTRAFIKVQEGCDNHCTYCLTRIARGKSQSRILEEVRQDVQAALEGGAQEIVLTGVQLGAWGRDLQQPKGLDDLIAGVLSINDVQRVRLSSIEPWDFDPVYLPLWEDTRLCRHLHIPLQSGDDQILKMMGRPIRSAGFADLVVKIREAVPDIAITTDMITGFPGETEAAFQTSLEFVKSLDFAGGHVFTYSPRPGTASYKMKDEVPIQAAKARNAELRNVFKEVGKKYRESFIDKQAFVLWESSDLTQDGTWLLSGLTDNYIRVYAEGETDAWNKITPVELETHHPERQALIGKIKTN
jgi:threonylcarbamoyladenosine tRNA methylthiotransferase MtaB